MFVLTRGDAIALCVGLGFKNAGKWNRERMTAKLKSLSTDDAYRDLEVDETVVEDEEERKRLNGILGQLRDENGEFEIVNREKSDEETSEIKEETSEEDSLVEEGKEEDSLVEESKEEDSVSTETPESLQEKIDPSKKQKKKSFGVRPSNKSRLYQAAIVIKRHGLKVGITSEMVKELDDLHGGKPNSQESRWSLGFAWHVINGFSS